MTTDNDSLLADLMADEQDDPTPNTEIPPTADGDAVNPPESDLLAELEGLGNDEGEPDPEEGGPVTSNNPADEPDLLAELEGTPDDEPADLPTPKPKPKSKAKAKATTPAPAEPPLKYSDDELADMIADRIVERLAARLVKKLLG